LDLKKKEKEASTSFAAERTRDKALSGSLSKPSMGKTLKSFLGRVACFCFIIPAGGTWALFFLARQLHTRLHGTVGTGIITGSTSGSNNCSIPSGMPSVASKGKF
jgi:hypothetical protein